MYENIKHKKEGFDVTQDKWFCPNCAELVFGYKDENGQTKVRCPKCLNCHDKIQKEPHNNNYRGESTEILPIIK